MHNANLSLRQRIQRIIWTVKQSRVIQVAILLVIIILAWAAYLRFFEHRGWAPWTGFGEFTSPDGIYYRSKNLWDWLELLIVPIVLAIGAYWFNKSEKANDLRIADDRQKEQALQNYLDKMTELLLGKKLLEKKDSPDDPVVEVAQIRTITTLRLLDTDRKNILLQFLRDANLAEFILVGASMNGADLSEANLSGINLRTASLIGTKLIGSKLKGTDLSNSKLVEADLSEAELSQAKLMETVLSGAKLLRTNLYETDLSKATLFSANLTEATLFNANLTEARLFDAILIKADLGVAKLLGAKLSGADLSGANLRRVDLSKATLRYAKLMGADLSGADLSGANLSNADLSRANLSDADLMEADLSDADLSDADLSGANLSEVMGISEQLAKVKSLKDATMPDGETFDPQKQASDGQYDYELGVLLRRFEKQLLLKKQRDQEEDQTTHP